ncbi:MAG: type I secretion system permease/ATPase [Kaiparowitsia implicata GSE-PSE-MK54-09C]|jgi:ATP-binding cassette subfamily C protein|nr:type I secretion system permease/ATPase [Kaiparowitsia implicata GSE-PSE-MK54-09C]
MPRIDGEATEGLMGKAMREGRGALLGVALVSALINMLYLTGSFFMLEVYDRVLPSQSVPTLIGLAVLVAMLYAFLGLFDFIRSRVLVRIGAALDARLAGAAFDMVVRLPLVAGPRAEAVQPLRSVDQIRGFLSGMGPSAFFDLPWMPFYLAICFIIHPWIGWTATIGAVLLISIALLTEALARRSSRTAQRVGGTRHLLAEAARRNADVLASMGLSRHMRRAWGSANEHFVGHTQRVADVTGGLGALSKVLRMLIQSAVLGVGAFLVINQEATGGLIIAASILAARALAPVELVVGNWQGFLAARQAWRRLKDGFALLPGRVDRLELPAPRESLKVENVSVVPPGGGRILVRDVSFALTAGDGLGIIGASASGKSSLTRALVGAWQSARGTVRLDGATLEQWGSDELGEHIGYLPQTVELFAGTVAQNIARFAPHADDAAVIAAAKAAGVHEMILGLPNGYETEIGEDGSTLSAGQRQRVALARALFGEPFLVVLDEPNSNLDLEGENALSQAIAGVRQRGGIAIVAAHRPSALAAVNLVLLMHEGAVRAFGPRDAILNKMAGNAPAAGVVTNVGGMRQVDNAGNF